MDGSACALDADCTLRIDTRGGGGRQGVGGGALFFWLIFAMLLGGAAAMGYVHAYGMPPWLPIRGGMGGYGMYNELSSEHGGI